MTASRYLKVTPNSVVYSVPCAPPRPSPWRGGASFLQPDTSQTGSRRAACRSLVKDARLTVTDPESLHWRLGNQPLRPPSWLGTASTEDHDGRPNRATPANRLPGGALIDGYQKVLKDPRLDLGAPHFSA